MIKGVSTVISSQCMSKHSLLFCRMFIMRRNMIVCYFLLYRYNCVLVINCKIDGGDDSGIHLSDQQMKTVPRKRIISFFNATGGVVTTYCM